MKTLPPPSTEDVLPQRDIAMMAAIIFAVNFNRITAEDSAKCAVECWVKAEEAIRAELE